MKNISILGSTGSIGTQTLQVVKDFSDKFNVLGLAAGENISLLSEQILKFNPDYFHCNGSNDQISQLSTYSKPSLNLLEMAADPNIDLLVTATSGTVAIEPTLKAIENGTNIALANKETIVVAGELVTRAAKNSGASIYPLDSEPNAIWQCLEGETSSIKKLIITASGGSVRDVPIEKLGNITPKDALNHPNWQMGSKITIDSATMMNKIFEIIEAHYLFNVPFENIEIVIHPQSIVHSLVEFEDGSIKAVLSAPDMRIPIQYVLLYPERIFSNSTPKLELKEIGNLNFLEPDYLKYPCIEMALEIAKRGLSWPAALAGADEAAVDLFLNGKIGFMDIPLLIEKSLKQHVPINQPNIKDLISVSEISEKLTRQIAGNDK